MTLTLDKDTSKENKAALLAVIADLDKGFLSIGGLTSKGRGIFEVDNLYVNGEDMTEEFKDFKFTEIIGGEQK